MPGANCLPRAGRRIVPGFAAVAVVAVALAGAGCASIPASGAVHSGRVLRQTSGPPQTASLANRPTPGEGPGAIVGGFLNALASPGDIGVARAYLTPTAQNHWHPSAGRTVYDDRSERWENQGHGRWVLQTRQLAVISPSGRWTVARHRLSVPFRLVRSGGQWRISVPPDRVVLADVYLGLSYDEYQLAFVGVATGRQVDVPVVLPDEQPGLANALVNSLLAGPPRPLTGAVTTAAPPGTATIGNVTVAMGVADVNLTSPARGLTGARLRTLGEQLLLTLQQVPGVRQVRLLVERAPLITVGSADPLHIAIAPQGGLVLTRPGGTVDQLSLAGTTTQQPPAASARAFLAPRWPRVAAALLRGDGEVVAATRGGGRQRLLIGLPGARPVAVTHARAIHLLQSSGRSALITVDGKLMAVTGHRVQRIRLPRGIARSGIQAAALAPDGVRIAIVAGPPGSGRLLLGALAPDRRAVGLQPVVPLEDPVGVDWSAADELVTTAAHGRTRVLVGVDSAGYAEHRSALPVGLRSVDGLCAAPLAATVVVGGGQAWSREDGQWTRLGPATSCAYPG